MSYVYILIVAISLLAVRFIKRRYYNLIIWSVTRVVGVVSRINCYQHKSHTKEYKYPFVKPSTPTFSL